MTKIKFQVPGIHPSLIFPHTKKCDERTCRKDQRAICPIQLFFENAIFKAYTSEKAEWRIQVPVSFEILMVNVHT